MSRAKLNIWRGLKAWNILKGISKAVYVSSGIEITDQLSFVVCQLAAIKDDHVNHTLL